MPELPVELLPKPKPGPELPEELLPRQEPRRSPLRPAKLSFSEPVELPELPSKL